MSEGEDFMKSLNFEFLRQEWPHLASLAGFAEMYANTDPVSSLIKLRTYTEQIAEVIYEQFGLQQKDLEHIVAAHENDVCQLGNPRDYNREECLELLEGML